MAIVITSDKRLARREVIIKNTHRGLWYEDGVLVRVLGAGRYLLPARAGVPFVRRPRVEVVLVDVRERELTIKGQEILTSDKVAIRVSIVVQFRVADPAAALEQVAEFEDRLYSDVQLAARRSLAMGAGNRAPERGAVGRGAHQGGDPAHRRGGEGRGSARGGGG